MSGGQDETHIKTNCTTAADLTNFKVGDRGLQINTTGAVTATVLLDPPGPTDPLVMPPASAIGLWVHVTNPAQVGTVTVEIYTDAALTAGKKFTRSTTGLTAGWNLVRWTASAGLADLTTWTTVYRVRVLAVTSAATTLTVGRVFAECPPKAQILLIEDRGYRTFVDVALPSLRALGAPVTWALDPALNGTGTGKAEVITDADVETFAAAGDSISIHSWDGSVTASMTADEIATDNLKAIRWLQQRGHAGRMWRASWTQNSATNAAAARTHLLAYATPTSASAITAWPFPDRWNVPRWSIHGRTTAAVDAMFTSLEASHGLLVAYTHGVHPDGGNDATPEEWTYFLDKATAAVAAGWLEFVTFEDLYARSGGRFVQGMGATYAEYLDEAGGTTRKQLP